MDFGKLSRPGASSFPIDPIEIFKRTPNLDDAPNDLWTGQSAALAQWNKARRISDVLISLNTGAGKSIVGLLVAQSLVNEKTPKILYVCSTNDLIKQTSREAKKLGFKFSMRFSGAFDNDLYETEKSFCITNYSTVFSAFSPFRTNLLPSAIIFDDAHVAEKYVRDAFTISIQRLKYAELFNRIISILTPSFEQIGRRTTLDHTIENKNSGPLMAPVNAGYDYQSQLSKEIATVGKSSKDIGLQSTHVAMKDFIKHSCIMISSNTIEITPPFLPTSAFPVLRDDSIRRIHLSATLKSKADMVRTFGREPIKIIEPENDAGNGERLIIFHKFLPQNLTGPTLAKSLVEGTKVLIAVPNKTTAEAYKEIASPPKTETFTEELNEFRSAERGGFVLNYRVDGIDLPHKTCRIMFIDGLPSGSSLLEKYQLSELSMRNLYNGRIANRLTQLFGRINRGRSDYGVFLIIGRDLNNWLDTERFMSLLPDLIHRQILLARNAIEKDVPNSIEDLKSLISAVLRREPSWLEYYRDWIDGVEINFGERERAAALEEGLVEIAKAEVAFANFLWQGDIQEAKEALVRVSEKATTLDAKIAGWHDLWLGHCAELLGDTEVSREYFESAKSRLSPRLPVRRYNVHSHKDSDGAPSLVESFVRELLDQGPRLVNDHIAKVRIACTALESGNLSPRQSEESIRTLGSLLGFDATRPDNELGRGPDVLWIDKNAKIVIPLELKTDKKMPATYRKKDDIGQAHDGIEWLAETFEGHTIPGYIFVGPHGRCSADAHPSEAMFLCSVNKLICLMECFVSLLEDLKPRIELERVSALRALRDRPEWQSEGIAKFLFEWPLKSLKKSDA